MEGVPIGDRLDALGVRCDIGSDDLVESAVVLLKVVELDGDTRLSIVWSEGISWLEHLGMVAAARDGEAIPAQAFGEYGEDD